MYARGLSTRDIEDALTDSTGSCLISKSAVSEITESLNEEFEAFKTRDLSPFNILYLFVDGLYESLRREERGAEAILVCWAILEDGRKVLIDLTLGNKESHTAWLNFFRDMTKRGLKTPLSITSDGAPGAVRAIEETWPYSLRVRCWFHKMQNLASKLPESRKAEVMAHKRRTKIILRFFGEKAALKLVFATLIRAGRR